MINVVGQLVPGVRFNLKQRFDNKLFGRLETKSFHSIVRLKRIGHREVLHNLISQS